MVRKVKKSGLRNYLYSLEGLDWESKTAIEKAKKEYYRVYKNESKKRIRKATKQFLISLSPAEVQELDLAVKKHKLMSKTRFIKSACFCYIHKSYLPTDPMALAIIRQLLGQTLIAIQRLHISNMLPADTGRQALSLLQDLERTVLVALYNPKEITV